MNLFVDTSFILALELTDDQHHDSALQCWRSLATRQPTLVATSYVFNEVVTSFNSRNRHDKAVEIGNRLLTSKVIQLVQVEENLFLEGWSYFQRYEDKSYSLTDCISFLVMAKMNIQKALTFDRHFVQAGFQKIP
ncbi:MAG: PIN domain-containing protein [Leptolyngbyaceae cyanobacterium CSU_1_4]|nr:PIN domain-containing protein [Leptolyngbyaceae cyanobacterium CSU_1_4]